MVEKTGFATEYIIMKGYMEYFVIYDLNDNIVAYIDNKYELCNFTKVRLDGIGYRFKNRNFINVLLNNKIYKVYRFFDN